MKDIYLVSQGSYSDYGVIGVFEKKEDAQLFIDKFQGEDSYDKMEIETRALNKFIPEIKQGLDSYRVRMQKDGAVSSCITRDDIPDLWREYFFDMKLNLVVDCMAKDQQHAIKIANERRIAALAEGKWRK